jgi:hypothetical protein
MTTAATLARTTPTPGKPDGTAETSTGSPTATDGTPPKVTGTGKIALQAHKPTARPAATAPGGATAGTPDAAGLLADLRRLWTRPAPAETAGTDKTSTARTGTGTAREMLPTGNKAGSTATNARTTGTPAPAPLARKPTAAEILAARKPARCLRHSPADYLDEPARNRPGYILTTCRRCGGFIGYRPAEPATHKRNARR